MHPKRVPRKATDDVAQILNPAFSLLSLGRLHRNRDGQGKRRFGFHPILGIPGQCPLQQFFHPFTVFPDRDDERHLHPGQKPEDLPGVELPIQAECLDAETKLGVRSRHRAM